MASTSDPPAAGGGDASSVAVVAAAAPCVEPLPPSSSSSKRRWSPCTWRYAIEEVQPELGSRPRSNSNSPFYSASSLRSGSEHAAPAPPTANKARPNHHQDHVYGKEGEEPVPVRRSAYSNRTWGGAELSELRARHAQPRVHDTLSRKKRPPHPQIHHQNQQKETVKRRSPKDDEEDEEEEDEEDDDDGDDAELGHHFEEGKKRKKREMSPSELYYCEICRAKAEASKGNVGADSPPPLQDP